jgi:hypothetical protein
MKTIIFISLFLIMSNANAIRCYTNNQGQRICGSNPQSSAIVVKPNNSAYITHNQNGVNRTYTSQGGRAVTKNGYGAVQGAGGKTCVRTRNGSGCN